MPTTFYLASESKAKKNGERPIIVSVHIKGHSACIYLNP